MHSSSSSCSSRTNDLTDETKPTKTTNSNKQLVIIGLPLSPLNPSSFLFFKSTSPTITNSKPSSNLQRLFTESSHILIRNLHNSIDECLSSLHLFASNNPLFIKLRSISSEFHKFNQINSRRQRNLNSMNNHNFAAIIPGDSMAGLVVSNGISNFLNIYNTLLVVRLVLTWFPNSPPAIVSPLSTLCDPYLNIFRGLIPPLGGTLDLSPILAFLVLNALTSTASALPAELPSHLTTSQTKWIKRFDSKKSKGSNIDE